MKLWPEDYNDNYYFLSKDLLKYPDCWCYIVYSKRGPGKTFSGLRYCYANNIKFVYIKRTNEDVDFICTESINSGIDPSPFSPLNRDFNLNVHAKKINKGFGGFYNFNDEGCAVGAPVGYIISLNSVKRIKGFNLDNVDIIIFDEFIPQPGEVVKTKEGEMLLDLYMTISRDRVERGRDPLKLILFANAEEISTPITNTLEITDIIAELGNDNYYVDNERGIMIHHITNEEIPIKESSRRGIYAAMRGTSWFDKSFGGEFSNNDFSNVKRMSIRKMRCLIRIKYKRKYYYIYYDDNKGVYYMCLSPSKYIYEYDLEKENDQKLFFIQFGAQLKIALAESRFYFQKYSMYDLIANYRKYFRL